MSSFTKDSKLTEQQKRQIMKWSDDVDRIVHKIVHGKKDTTTTNSATPSVPTVTTTNVPIPPICPECKVALSRVQLECRVFCLGCSKQANRGKSENWIYKCLCCFDYERCEDCIVLELKL